jgi:hypothetical protein
MAYKESFLSIDFSGNKLPDDEFENCRFNGCTFTDISGISSATASLNCVILVMPKQGLQA